MYIAMKKLDAYVKDHANLCQLYLGKVCNTTLEKLFIITLYISELYKMPNTNTRRNSSKT